jgi:phasin family protein
LGALADGSFKRLTRGDGRPTRKGETSCPRTANGGKKGTGSEHSRRKKSAALNESKPIEQGTAGETPFFDLTELMSQFRLPGVDFAALVDRERKNIQALAEANRIAFEGSQRLIHRQAEILLETMKKVIADAGRVDAMSRMELAQEGFEKALANMRELAEMGAEYQREAFEVVRKRIEENMEGIRNSGKKVGD